MALSLNVFSQQKVPPGTSSFTSLPNGFWIDGYLVRQTGSPGDWVDDIFNTSGVKQKTFAIHAIDKFSALGADDNLITSSGSKSDDDPNDWTWGIGDAQDKGDLNHALIYIAKDNTSSHNIWGLFSADRKEDNGGTTVQFEFLQTELTLTSTGFHRDPSTASTGGRTVGDIMISLSMSSSASIEYFKWSLVGTYYKYVKFIPAANDAFVAVNDFAAPLSSIIDVPYGAYGGNTYGKNQFIEGAINISHMLNRVDPLNPDDPGICSSANFVTVFIKTQTGASTQSSLEDFITPIPFRFNVNSASIAYNDICTNATNKTLAVNFGAGSIQTGSFTSNLPSGLNTSTGDIDITGISAGTYSVTYSYVDECGTSHSTDASFKILAAPGTPVATVTQPTCTNATGSVHITSPVAGITYTLTLGATVMNSTNGEFTSVAAGTYSLTASNEDCTAAGLDVTVNTQPTSMTAPTTGSYGPLCSNGSAQPLTGDPTGGIWSGTGVAGNQNDGYTFDPSVGSQTLTYTVTNGVCSNTNTCSITVNLAPTANAGDPVAAICQSGTTDGLGGSFGGSATSAVWSDHGAGGSFANNGGLTPGTATYTASATAASSITLYLETSGGLCGSATATKSLTVNPNPTADAGAAVAAICQGGTTAALNGSYGGGATSAIWSDHGAGGSFANNTGTTPGTATYTASASAGSTITL
jgi:hypothetical protein